ncbi:MAG: hypothetical protein HC942_13595 [Microcoleus sp. SU_5_6]|nr:hypothetical protein [Microcoleus sp. SU_5_6]
MKPHNITLNSSELLPSVILKVCWRWGFLHQTFLEYTIVPWMSVTKTGDRAKYQLKNYLTNFELVGTNYQLPITNYQLPITHYPFPDIYN